MKQLLKLLGCLCAVVLVVSCKETEEQRIARHIKYWENKEILFPKDYAFTVYGKDTVDFPWESAEHKILVYVDSTGCIGCKMQLEIWEWFIKDLDSISNGEIPVGFFIHPEEKGDMQDLLKDKKFAYPVCLDLEDELWKLNQFQNHIMLQTFLLDKENRVIAVGNPVHNLKIWELYMEMIKAKFRK